MHTRHTTHDTRHTTHDTRHTTHDTRHTTHGISRLIFLLLFVLFRSVVFSQLTTLTADGIVPKAGSGAGLSGVSVVVSKSNPFKTCSKITDVNGEYSCSFPYNNGDVTQLIYNWSYGANPISGVSLFDAQLVSRSGLFDGHQKYK
jgi:hypothetical protein